MTTARQLTLTAVALSPPWPPGAACSPMPTSRLPRRRYPLRFDGKAALFYNIQGYLMQSLGTAMPGLFTLSDSHDPADSDVLQYSRHEFTSYFLQHVERKPHALDASDASWHGDGTRHIDHNHLILALPGTLSNGALPSATIPGPSQRDTRAMSWPEALCRRPGAGEPDRHVDVQRRGLRRCPARQQWDLAGRYGDADPHVHATAASYSYRDAHCDAHPHAYRYPDTNTLMTIRGAHQLMLVRRENRKAIMPSPFALPKRADGRLDGLVRFLARAPIGLSHLWMRAPSPGIAEAAVPALQAGYEFLAHPRKIPPSSDFARRRLTSG